MTRRGRVSFLKPAVAMLVCAAVVTGGCRSIPTTQSSLSSGELSDGSQHVDMTSVEELLGPVPSTPATREADDRISPEALLAYMDARMALAGGEIDDAIDQLNKALKSNPRHTDSLRLITRMQFERGQVKLAERYARRLLQIDPADVTANFVLGSVLMQSEAKAEAATYLYRAVTAAGREDMFQTTHALISRFLLGQYLSSEGYIRAAVEVYVPLLDELDHYAEAQMSRDPRIQKLVLVYRPGITLLVADFLRRMGRTDEARGYYHQAREFPAVAERAQRGLVRCYLDAGDRKKAQAEFDKLIRTVPIDEAMIELCRKVYPEGRWAERLLRVFEPNAENYRLAMTLARTLIDHDKLADGYGLLEKLVAINPNDAELIELMMHTSERTGRMDRFAALIVEALASQKPPYAGMGTGVQQWSGEDARRLAEALDDLEVPDSQRFARAYLRGRIAESADRLDKAETFYRKAVALNDAFVPAHVAMAELMLGKRRWASALSAAEALLAESPDSPALLYVKGRALAEMDRLEESADTLTRSLELSPQSGRSALVLADVYLRQNQAGAALALLRRIVTTQIAGRETLLRAVSVLIYAKELALGEAAVERFRTLYGDGPDAEVLEAKLRYARTLDRKTYREALENQIGKTSRPRWAVLLLSELAFQSDDFAAALKHAEKVLSDDARLWPRDYYRALQIVAISRWRRLEYDQAERAWQKLLDDWPDRESLLTALGKMYSDAQRYGKAEAVFERLLDMQDGGYKALTIQQLIVASKLRQGELDEAVADIRGWIDASDKPLVTLALKELLVDAWLDRKRYDRAEAYLDTLLNEGSERRQLWQQKLIAAYVVQGKTDAASDRLQRWLIDSEGADQWAFLEGLKVPVLLKAGQYEDAILLARMLFREADAKAKHRRGLTVVQCYQDASRYAEAEAFISKQLETIPDASAEQRRYQFQLIRTMELAGQFDRAEAYIKRNLAEAQIKEHWQQWLVGSFFARGKFDEGIALLETILDETGDVAWACNSLGYTLADTNRQLDRAETLIRKALSHDPGNAAYLDSLAWALYRKGRFSEAETYARMARTGMGNEVDPVLLDHLADILTARGKTSEARDYWQKALDALKHTPAIDTEPGLRERLLKKLDSNE